MKRFKLEAFAREFPWLVELLGEELYSVDSVQVKRLDEKVLGSIPSTYFWDGSAGVTDQREAVHFILADGSLIRDAVRCAEERGSNYAHSQRILEDGETVLEAIDRHGVADSLQFVVWEHKLLDDWEGKDREESHEVVIYKLPRGARLKDLLLQAQVDALREVKGELSEVDDALWGTIFYRESHAGDQVFYPFTGSIQELVKELRELEEEYGECECCLPVFKGKGLWAGFFLEVEPETRRLSWGLSAWRAERMGLGYRARDLGAIEEPKSR